MQFMNSNLDSLTKNLPDNDLKHLFQEFRRKCVKSVKQKRVYPYEYIHSFLRQVYLIKMIFVVV